MTRMITGWRPGDEVIYVFGVFMNTYVGIETQNFASLRYTRICEKPVSSVVHENEVD